MSAILFHTLLFCLCSADGPSAPRVRIASFNIWELSAEKISKVDSAGHGTHRQLRGAADYTRALQLRPETVTYRGWGSGDPLQFSDSTLLNDALGQG